MQRSKKQLASYASFNNTKAKSSPVRGEDLDKATKPSESTESQRSQTTNSPYNKSYTTHKSCNKEKDKGSRTAGKVYQSTT